MEPGGAEHRDTGSVQGQCGECRSGWGPPTPQASSPHPHGDFAPQAGCSVLGSLPFSGRAPVTNRSAPDAGATPITLQGRLLLQMKETLPLRKSNRDLEVGRSYHVQQGPRPRPHSKFPLCPLSLPPRAVSGSPCPAWPSDRRQVTPWPRGPAA